MVAGSWRLMAGSWRLVAGGWWLEDGSWRLNQGVDQTKSLLFLFLLGLSGVGPLQNICEKIFQLIFLSFINTDMREANPLIP
jgi:hypothetical protein